jgi:hypothetical protein
MAIVQEVAHGPLIPALTAGSKNDLEHGCAQTQARDAVSVEATVRSIA